MQPTALFVMDALWNIWFPTIYCPLGLHFFLKKMYIFIYLREVGRGRGRGREAGSTLSVEPDTGLALGTLRPPEPKPSVNHSVDCASQVPLDASV